MSENKGFEPDQPQNEGSAASKDKNANGVYENPGDEPKAEVGVDEDDSCNACNCACLEKCSNFITSKIENVFYRLGVFTGTYPWATILIGIALFLLPLPGYAFFYNESDAAKLWVPQNSRAIEDRDQSKIWFPSLLRVEQALIVSGNVLTADTMQKALDLDINIKAIQVNYNVTVQWTYANLCFKSGPFCLENSILEAWDWDEATIDALSNSDVEAKVNEDPLLSGQTTAPMNAESLLGGVTEDASNVITGARAMIMTYYVATADLTDPEDYVLDWEDAFLDVCKTGVPGLEVYRFAYKSPTDIGSGAASDDAPFLFAGYGLVILFLCATLGKFNARLHKVWLGLAGIVCVGFSISISFSSASLFQLDYGPLHSVLPFLLLGIGVDDMFVFVSAWDNLSPAEQLLPLRERIGAMTRHAGVSILITSLTDFAAFLIGATTIIPALRSFCVFAAMGILGIFLLTLMLFSGLLTYDQLRAEKNRDACCCCIYLGDDYKPNSCSEQSFSEKVFDQYIARALLWTPMKIAVIVVTVGLLATGIAGTAMIEQDFDPNWFIPEGNYLYEYLEKSEDYFPGDGDEAYVLFGEIDYYDNVGKLETLPGDLEEVSGVAKDSTDFYLTSFYDWLDTYAGADTDITSRIDPTTKDPTDEANFIYLLKDKFLLEDVGKAYTSDINFNDAGDAITSSRMKFVFSQMPNSAKRIEAMDDSRKVVDDMDFGEEIVFVYSDAFLVWEGDKVIFLELFRNIGMAFIVVFLVCMLLIANIATVLLVLSCVVFTLVDVIGLIHFWGVTISTVSTINLILAIGLAVDYAAHIGHAFMACTGSRRTRTRVALAEIGPAVFSGGFSTFLAFFPLCISTSFVFQTFFKIFFLVCVLGLFHGLVYLPVMLSWFGPSPYSTAHAPPSHHHQSNTGGDQNGQVNNAPPPPSLSPPTHAHQAHTPEEKNWTNVMIDSNMGAQKPGLNNKKTEVTRM